jgi:hypothetical protein
VPTTSLSNGPFRASILSPDTAEHLAFCGPFALLGKVDEGSADNHICLVSLKRWTRGS